ncbi:MAG TPA: hypothetical protein EYP86_04895 [Candidatus Altiarchaeales archaeon]|nr:hypothetical protein [Candidatus Altiarchaeales archaeon]
MVESKYDRIMNVLENLYNSHEDIKACMVVRSGFEGVTMFPENFVEEISDVWDPINKSLNELLDIIAKYSIYEVDKSYIEILNFGIFLCTIGMTDTALITFINLDDKTDSVERVSQKMNDILRARDEIVEIES